jgi:uncharacterized FlaG/YvyC family protein
MFSSNEYSVKVKNNNTGDDIELTLVLEIDESKYEKVYIDYKSITYSYLNIIKNISGVDIDSDERMMLDNTLGTDIKKSLEDNKIEIKFKYDEECKSYIFEVYYNITRFCRYSIILKP